MKNKSFKLATLISLITIVILASTATFAWFYMNSDVEVDYGNEIVCETGSSLEISHLVEVDEHGQEEWSDYSTSITIETPAAKLQDVTGDGLNLYTPSALETINGVLTPVKFAKSKPMDEKGFGDYIEIQLKLRTTSPMNVYFAEESFILPYDLEKEITNVFGNFSQDYIAGAMRLAIIEKKSDSSEELKMVWAPNSTYQLYKDAYNNYRFTETGKVEQYKYYECVDEENETYELHNVTSDEIVSNKFVVGSTKTNDVMVNQSPLLARLTPDSDGFGVVHFIVRVWFEGCDREADQALSGGRCKMKFVFSGMEAKETAKSDVVQSINKINYSCSSSTVEDTTIYTTSWTDVPNNVYFSLNGYDWTKYDGSNIPNVYEMVMNTQNNVSIYFKSEETLDNYSFVRKIEIPYTNGGGQ